MKRTCAVLILSLGMTSPLVRAANGDLLDRTVVNLEEEARPPLAAALEAIRADVELSRIVYESDGLKVRGYLAMPRKGAGLPCVIFNRGGNREFGSLDDTGAALTLGTIARRGYVAVASQYRGNAGGEGKEEFGGAEVQDILSLIPLLEALPRADAARIGMFGWSRGGMMTYLALARTDRIRAAIVGAGVADSFDMLERRPKMEDVYSELVPGWKERREAALVARSALRWPEKLSEKTPILILHGTADWRVHPTQSLRMAEALLEAKRPYRLILFEGGDHSLSEFREEVREAVAAWLDRYVRDGASWPSLEPHGN